MKKNNLIIALTLFLLSHWVIACKCTQQYQWLTMREYNTRTVFVGKLLSVRTPPENLLTMELKYQVVTNYRNTPVGDTIIIFRPQGNMCDMSAEEYQVLIGRESLIYPTYYLGSYDVPVCAELQLTPPESVENWKKKLPLAQAANRLDIVEICNNVIHTWQLIDEVKQRGNKMMKSYHANGVLEAKGKLKNSMPDGEWKYYDDKGRLLEVTNYKEGIKWGKSKWYTYDNDTTYSGIRYYENDLGINETSWINGRLTDKLWGTSTIVNSYRKSNEILCNICYHISYDASEKPTSKRVQKLVDKEKKIYYTEQYFYYPNGQVKEQWTEKYEPHGSPSQSKIGKWLRYAENGQLIREVPYNEYGYEINQENK